VDPDCLPPPRPAPCKEEVSVGRVLDANRFLCLARPQYKRSCGISSLVSVFNFLYSPLGTRYAAVCADIGREPAPEEMGIYNLCPALYPERALQLLGFPGEDSGGESYRDIRFGKFTGNATLIRWFRLLCSACGVSGTAGYLWKRRGAARTGISSAAGMARVHAALASPSTGLIYHGLNHYSVPVGVDVTPASPIAVYDGLPLGASPLDLHNTWLMIADASRGSAPLRSLRFSFVAKDLGTVYPEFYDFRHPERGLQSRRPLPPPSEPCSAGPTPPTAAEPSNSEVEQSDCSNLGEGPETTPAEEAEEEPRADFDADDENESGPDSAAEPDGVIADGLAGAPKKKKKKRGNLHCLLYFSADQHFSF
jgi:hypothetical protein